MLDSSDKIGAKNKLSQTVKFYLYIYLLHPLIAPLTSHFYTFKQTQMKSLQVFLLWCVTMFFTSCNGSEEKTTSTSLSTDTTATTASTADATTSSITTTPQNMLVVTYKVSDFAKWRVSYDVRDSMRVANGIHSYVISRGIKDSNTVMLALKIDDVAKAKAFTKDAALKKAMQKGNVLGDPVYDFITMVYQDTSVSSAPIRSRASFMVKDWATWQKSFEGGAQERMENGLTLRAYGHDVDNPNKVVVVTSVTDSAKAAAYWTSDRIKKRWEESGVIGQPQRFLYRVVQRF